MKKITIMLIVEICGVEIHEKIDRNEFAPPLPPTETIKREIRLLSKWMNSQWWKIMLILFLYLFCYFILFLFLLIFIRLLCIFSLEILSTNIREFLKVIFFYLLYCVSRNRCLFWNIQLEFFSKSLFKIIENNLSKCLTMHMMLAKRIVKSQVKGTLFDMLKRHQLQY